jgi:pyridoxamine 5'-phosphate oxidase family protein
MAPFTDDERAYLAERRLARLATVGPDGTPHITPIGMWQLTADAAWVEVTGRNFAASKKYRDVVATGRAAIVVDDLASTDPWRPRGVEIRGAAEALAEPEPHIRIHPDRVISWGLEGASSP